MATRQLLVADLDQRANRRLADSLSRYLRELAHLSAADVARRWIVDQEFWAPRRWLQGLLGRPDREQLVTRAVARLIVLDEQERLRRQHGRRDRFRLGRAGRPRPSSGFFNGVRACR
jgi:hypothetical protein